MEGSSGTVSVIVDRVRREREGLRVEGLGVEEPDEPRRLLAALRAKRSRPVIDEIRTWLMTQRALPRSSLGKAIATRAACGPDSCGSSRFQVAGMAGIPEARPNGLGGGRMARIFRRAAGALARELGVEIPASIRRML
jgi:hypothetical protein